jgi:hypothetical protein
MHFHTTYHFHNHEYHDTTVNHVLCYYDQPKASNKQIDDTTNSNLNAKETHSQHDPFSDIQIYVDVSAIHTSNHATFAQTFAQPPLPATHPTAPPPPEGVENNAKEI